MMVGEKAVHRILEREILAREEPEPRVHADWRERQR